MREIYRGCIITKVKAKDKNGKIVVAYKDDVTGYVARTIIQVKQNIDFYYLANN
jgi:hypothetical protein